jgi:magnesium-transporting ATPase (P-type)
MQATWSQEGNDRKKLSGNNVLYRIHILTSVLKYFETNMRHGLQAAVQHSGSGARVSAYVGSGGAVPVFGKTPTVDVVIIKGAPEGIGPMCEQIRVTTAGAARGEVGASRVRTARIMARALRQCLCEDYLVWSLSVAPFP